MKARKENNKEKTKSLYNVALEQNKGIILKVRGWSMFPFLCRGDKVLIRRYSKYEVRIGDVVLFQEDAIESELPTLHRVIMKNIPRNILIIKGDSLLNFDKPIKEEEVLGYAAQVRKKNMVITLDRAAGRCINIIFWFLSVTYLLPVAVKTLLFILRKTKKFLPRFPPLFRF